MVIVRILGGLGNQMFQYAYAKSLDVKGINVKLDLSEIKKYKLHGGYQLDKFNITVEHVKKLKLLFFKLNPFYHFKEKNLMFDKNLLQFNSDKYVKGYFQSEKYFLNIRETLLENFTFNKKKTNSTNKYIDQIKKIENSCSIHIRRGDYVTNLETNQIHGICSLKYYEKGIQLIMKKYKNVKFYIFSDDISWAKKNLKITDSVFIDHKCTPHEDLYLMSICKHNITANSSFSWWGAWLNKNKSKTVIAPTHWYKTKNNEIVPKNWIKI
jgi:hypothetical protein